MSQISGPQGRPRLRILTVAYSGLPVPPPMYGGLERGVYDQIIELVRRGHHVTLMAAKGSRVPCPLITYSDRPTQARAWRGWAKLSFWVRLFGLLPHFDILNWHCRADYITPALLHPRIPKVVTFHNPIWLPEVEWYHRRLGRSVTFVSLSDAQARHVRHIGDWATIPYGFPLNSIQAVTELSGPGYLVFLGRLSRIKGVHRAIAVAEATGLPLKIAGNIVHDPEDEAYFRDEIAPRLVPGKIDYVEQVDDHQKYALLGGARALLFPIEWEEPFGRVLGEAMACGTPAIAFNRGAVAEIITHGVNGLICDSLEEMVDAVQKVDQIDRAACRREAEARFSIESYVERYEELFQELVEACRR